MDTVVLKLHNLDNYKEVLRSIHALKTGGGRMVVERDRVAGQDSKNWAKIYANMKYSNFMFIDYNDKLNLPSSYSGVRVQYLDSHKVLKFEYSVPKFLFGNNVIDIIPPTNSTRYYKTNQAGIYDMCDLWYSLIKHSFKVIIQSLTKGLTILQDFQDVEVARVDVAFNQIFESQRDAKHYIEAQKLVRAPRIVNQTTYSNGFGAKSKDYYFKIYHKGEEYRAKQRAQISNYFLEYEKIFGKKVHDTKLGLSYQLDKQLETYADRLVRYELGCYSGFLSHTFNYYFLKKNIKEYRLIRNHLYRIFRDDNFQLLKQTKLFYLWNGEYYTNLRKVPKGYGYKKVYRKRDFNEETNQRIWTELEPKEIILLEKLVYSWKSLKQLPDVKIFNDLIPLYKHFKNEEGRKFEFFLDKKKTEKIPQFNVNTGEVFTYKITEHIDEVNDPNQNIFSKASKRQHFSKNLFRQCMEKLMFFFYKYQMDEMPSVKTIERLAIEYNERIIRDNKALGTKHQKMNVRQMKLIALNLERGMTWEIMKANNIYSRTTIHRYKRKFEALMDLDKTENFITDIDLKKVVKDGRTLFSEHYRETLNPNNVIQLFIQDGLLV